MLGPICRLQDGKNAAPRSEICRALYRMDFLTANGRLKVARIEERELEAHRAEIIADVKKMVEKYRKIFDWDVPDIDQAAADRLILSEVVNAVRELEVKLLG
jgi:hypothetical protein